MRSSRPAVLARLSAGNTTTEPQSPTRERPYIKGHLDEAPLVIVAKRIPSSLVSHKDHQKESCIIAAVEAKT